MALRRAETFCRCGARVRVVSPRFQGQFPQGAELLCRAFDPADLEGVVLAVAATNDRAVNRLLAEEATKRGVRVSVADSAGESTFYFPSLIVEGDAAVSVSTAGLSPDLTHRLSNRLRETWALWVQEESLS